MNILIFEYIHIQTSLYFLTLMFNIYCIIIFFICVPSLILLGEFCQVHQAKSTVALQATGPTGALPSGR